MGQCSSTTKQQRGKSNENPAYELETAEEEEEGLVAPQTGAPARRRAIDEQSAATRKEQKAVSNDIQGSTGPVEDFGLAALRPSIDDRTCTALLALRMGRGSSVGGLIAGQSGEGRGPASSLDTMGPVPENASVSNGGVPGPDERVGQDQEAHRRRRHLGKQLSSSDSNERLEKILALGKVGDAPSVPVRS